MQVEPGQVWFDVLTEGGGVAVAGGLVEYRDQLADEPRDNGDTRDAAGATAPPAVPGPNQMDHEAPLANVAKL